MLNRGGPQVREGSRQKTSYPMGLEPWCRNLGLGVKPLSNLRFVNGWLEILIHRAWTNAQGEDWLVMMM
jgi:hypothetical protein